MNSARCEHPVSLVCPATVKQKRIRDREQHRLRYHGSLAGRLQRSIRNGLNRRALYEV
jgi:hypothetical protein